MLQFVGLGAADTEHGRGELKDSFAKLHAALSLGSVPDSLPCREEERKRLGGFLGRAMHEGELEHTFSCLKLDGIFDCRTAHACRIRSGR
jgi:hypothetical protein